MAWGRLADNGLEREGLGQKGLKKHGLGWVCMAVVNGLDVACCWSWVGSKGCGAELEWNGMGSVGPKITQSGAPPY